MKYYYVYYRHEQHDSFYPVKDFALIHGKPTAMVNKLERLNLSQAKTRRNQLAKKYPDLDFRVRQRSY